LEQFEVYHSTDSLHQDGSLHGLFQENITIQSLQRST